MQISRPQRIVWLVATCLAVAAPALATPDPQPPGSLLRPPLLFVSDADVGAELADPGFDAFLARHGGDWSVSYDAHSGRLARITGSGIALVPGRGNSLPGPPVRTLATVAERAHAVVRGIADRHGVAADELVLGPVSGRRGGDGASWMIEFRRQVGGVEVFGSRAFARIRHGNLVVLGFDRLFPIPAERAVPAVSGDDALDAVQEEFGGAGAEVGEPQLRFRTFAGDGGTYGAVLVWEVVGRRTDAPGTWRGLVDAATGWVVEIIDETRETVGRVTGYVHPRVEPAVVEAPFLNQTVDVGGDVVVTNRQGWYSSGNQGLITMSLGGLSPPGGFAIRNFTGDDARHIEMGTATVHMRWDDDNSDPAERDAFYHLQRVRQFVIDTQLVMTPWFTEVVPVEVNADGICNAAWDLSRGELIFRDAGPGCNDTGQIADVMYHEWMHGLVANTDGEPDGAGEEALADITARLLTGDPLYAPTFFERDEPRRLGALADHTALRDASQRVGLDNLSRRCEPAQCDGSLPYECHCQGLILSGAVWDLYELLRDRWGRDQATDIITELHCLTFTDWATYPGAYIHYLAVDDDDGDLSNGTPNGCLIYEAFQRHGIAPNVATCSPGLVRLALTGDQVVDSGGDGDGYAEPGEVVEVELTVSNSGDATARGGWAVVATTVAGVQVTRAEARFPDVAGGAAATSTVHAELSIDPSVPCGTRVPLTVTLGFASPVSSYAGTAEFLVGEPWRNRFTESFDGPVPDWTSEGDAVDGHWLQGAPLETAHDGDVYQSDGPYRGAGCLFTGQNPSWMDLGSSDVDRGTATAVSPPFSLAGALAPAVQFRYWFASAYVRSQPADVFRVEISNGLDTVTLMVENESASEWRFASLPLQGLIDPTASMQLRFHVTDDHSLTRPSNFVEAAIDELAVVEYDCSSNPGCDPGVQIAVIGRSNLCVGESTTFVATPSRCVMPSYQWLLDGVPIAGATDPAYTVPPVIDEGGYRYEVEVTCESDPGCTVRVPLPITVSSATALVDTAAVSHCTGATTVIDGSGSMVTGCLAGARYEWLLDGIEIPGADQPILAVPDSFAPGSHELALRVSCASASHCFDVSTPVALDVTHLDPRIAEPEPRRVCAGASATFDGTGSVVGNCPGGPTWQWQFDGADVPGATAPVMTTGPIDPGVHVVTLRLGCAGYPGGCEVTSTTVELLVEDVPPPAVDGSLRAVENDLGPGTRLSWQRGPGSGGTWNVHRVVRKISLPVAWAQPPLGWSDAPSFLDPAEPVGRLPWLYQVFGADCAGLSVP